LERTTLAEAQSNLLIAIDEEGQPMGYEVSENPEEATSSSILSSIIFDKCGPGLRLLV